MSNVSIYGKKWIDLVFEDRNQKYGAYQLRQENPKITLLALFYGVLLFGGFASVLIISSLGSDQDLVTTTTNYPEEYVLKVSNLTQPHENPKVDEVIKTTPPNTVIEPVEQKINLLSNLVIIETPLAVDIPTNKELETISTSAIQGTTVILGIGTDEGKDSGKTNGTILGTGSDRENSGVDIPSKSNEVDKLPTFPNGIDKFYKYVATNFKNPDLESGTIVSVLVAFIVEKDGTLSNIRVLRNSGIGTDKEAIRVLSALKTKWIPGIKNGEKVRTEFTLPIKVKFN